MRLSPKKASSRTFQSKAVIFAFVASSFVGSAALAHSAPVAPSSAQSAPAPAPAGVGGGDVNLTPKRVVIIAGRSNGEITVFNRGTGTGRYELSLEDRFMTPEGNIQSLKDASDEVKAQVRSASGFAKISPRRVTLPPSSVQTVRVSARVPADLPDGEYRTHFSVIAAPNENDGLSIEDATNPLGPGEIRVRIIPKFGISIPIIIRKGQTQVTAGIEDLRIAPNAENKPTIQFTITRKGNRSVFGDFEVFATSVGGAREKIGEIKGVAVYPEIERRAVSIALIKPDSPPTKGSRLEVVYKDDDFKPGAILATAQAVVP